jgi:Spy/CpxP family protein refolding chaperone
MSTRIVATVVVVLVFFAGIFIGAAGERIWLIHHGPSFPPKMEGGFVNRVISRLDQELHFTPQQRQQITQILESRRQRINGIWSSVGPQVRQQVEETNAEIEKVLTPEQRTKFAEIRARMKGRHHGRFGRM